MEPETLPSTRPNTSLTEVQAHLSSLYNICAKTIKELTAYDDRNYHIVCSDDSGAVTEYVFKITNAYDTQNKFNSMLAQCDLMTYLNGNGICCSQVIHNNAGQPISIIELGDYRHAVRLYTFVKGITLEEAIKQNLSSLYFQAGKYCGRLTNALIEYPKCESFLGQEINWSLENATKSRKYIDLLNDEQTKKIIHSIFDQFEQRILKNKIQFKQGLLHSDLNCNNIIVEKLNDKYEVVGVIDFGEVDWSLLVFDLAILVAHIIEHADGDIGAGTHVIKGYLTERQLSDIELSVLCLAVKTRVAQCLVLCNEAALRDPTNLYIRDAVESTKNMLGLINSVNEEEVLTVWEIKNK